MSRRANDPPSLPILVQTPDFVVLDKPPGLPVHAGPSGGPSVEDWFPALSRRRSGPWLAHRLDADTSGCLVVALRRAALHAAQAAFAAGQAEKEYWAIVLGRPHASAGTIDVPLLKRSTPAGWLMVADPTGQPARTTWRIMGEAPGFTWLALHPHTGRTHQVRVHAATLGCPLLGDPVYGQRQGEGEGRLHLLARSIALPLASPLKATAPPPSHMLDALRACGRQP